MKFASTISSKSAVARASKALQAEITRKENKTQESMEQSEAFVLSEQSIREIIRQEINRTQETSAANNRSRNRRKVSFSGSLGRENGSENHKQRPHRQNKSNSPHRRSKQAKHQQKQRARSKSPGSNPNRRVTRPRSSSKNAKGQRFRPGKIVACENIRFSSLFGDGDVSRRGASATQRQKFHTDEIKSLQIPGRSADWSTK